MDRSVCCYPQGVRQLFPRDAALQDLRAESYFGTTLLDSEGRPIGLIAVIGHRALHDPKRAASLLKLVAPRAASELERRQVEEAVRASEERHRTVLQTAMDGFWLADTAGRLLEVNETYCRMSGYSAQELLAMRIADLETVETADVVAAHIQKIMAEGEDRFESRHRRQDGSIFDVEVSVQYQPTEGGRLVGFLRDITERKRAEEILRQREEELSIKSRNLEELNTALKVLLKQKEEDRYEMEENVLTNVKTSILPYIEKVKEGPLTPHQTACLEILEAQTKKIISPFLHKISHACFDLTPQEIRVADLVKNGNATKEIADILGISSKTVDYHRDNIRKKLGLKNHHTNLRSFLLKLS
jgi:PAS domain S-box-containing protein